MILIACKVTDGDLLVLLTNMAHLPLVFCALQMCKKHLKLIPGSLLYNPQFTLNYDLPCFFDAGTCNQDASFRPGFEIKVVPTETFSGRRKFVQ